jgi:hypothetical protein
MLSDASGRRVDKVRRESTLRAKADDPFEFGNSRKLVMDVGARGLPHWPLTERVVRRPCRGRRVRGGTDGSRGVRRAVGGGGEQRRRSTATTACF